jgi:putative membrane protein
MTVDAHPLAAARRTAWTPGGADLAFHAALVAAGALLWWLSTAHASLVPAFGPWDFSWTEFLATGLVLWWYGRGLAALPAAERPPALRQGLFLGGLVLTYAVLQTHFDYLAQHMFFLNRTQHIVIHHLGPMLMVLGWPGPVLRRGMPGALRRLIDHPAVGAALAVVQQPVVASVLFVGLIALWLTPAVHFRAMIDLRLYVFMNWTMVVDGVLFWALVLDPRPQPPARLSFGARAACALAVMFPQIVIGAAVAFSSRDLYPFYAYCGRIYAAWPPLYDQALGGMIVWIPGAMMSIVAVLLVLNRVRLNDERAILSQARTHLCPGVVDRSSGVGAAEM